MSGHTFKVGDRVRIVAPALRSDGRLAEITVIAVHAVAAKVGQAGIRYASRLLSKPPAAFLATIVDLKGNEVARVLGASVALPRPVA